MKGVRGVVLAVVTCAVLLPVTGCGSAVGGSVPAPSDGASAGVAAGAHSGTDSGKATPAENKASVKKQTSHAPKVPRAELTPATGSFTEKQRQYLDGRVPKGIDPAAVLAGGKEICERITRTEEADRKAVIEAIKSKEIAGAKAAVTHLCPRHKDLLAAAGT